MEKPTTIAARLYTYLHGGQLVWLHSIRPWSGRSQKPTSPGDLSLESDFLSVEVEKERLTFLSAVFWYKISLAPLLTINSPYFLIKKNLCVWMNETLPFPYAVFDWDTWKWRGKNLSKAPSLSAGLALITAEIQNATNLHTSFENLII